MGTDDNPNAPISAAESQGGGSVAISAITPIIQTRKRDSTLAVESDKIVRGSESVKRKKKHQHQTQASLKITRMLMTVRPEKRAANGSLPSAANNENQDILAHETYTEQEQLQIQDLNHLENKDEDQPYSEVLELDDGQDNNQEDNPIINIKIDNNLSPISGQTLSLNHTIK